MQTKIQLTALIDRLSVSLVQGNVSRAPLSDAVTIMSGLLPTLRGLAETVEYLADGVFLVASDSRAIYMNRAAEQVINAKDGLILDCGRIRARSAQDSAALDRLIGRATQRSAPPSTRSVATLRVARRGGGRPLELTVLPIDSAITCAIYISNLKLQLPSAENAFAQRYGLTPAECRVALCIAGGMSGGEAAVQLSVSYNTVKTHLKRVFAKTQTQRQASLVRLMGQHFQGTEDS